MPFWTGKITNFNLTTQHCIDYICYAFLEALFIFKHRSYKKICHKCSNQISNS